VNPFNKRAVSHSPELKRVLEIPRRAWTDAQLVELAKTLTGLLRTLVGTMALRPIQALALHDIGTHGGLFGPIRVGGGKTLISLLAPYMLGSKRPMLFLPASLIEKTERERRLLAKHWRIPTHMRIQSYEMMGRSNCARLLDEVRPDLLVLDEAHKVKNAKAGVSRRFIRYMRENPDTKVVAISGTMMKSSIRDFGRILRWCLKDQAPVPEEDGELEEWADALDENSNFLKQIDPGALTALCNAEEKASEDTTTAARRGFQRRLTDTAGVVSTGGDQVACSLYINALPLTVSKATEDNFKKLREEWRTPDDWDISEAIAVWRHAKELALGFHYVWDPRPPDDWRLARSAWKQRVRKILSHSHHLDTEKQVADECRAGEIPRQEFDAWKAIEKTFIPNVKAVWHDTSALEACQRWMQAGPGIVWTEHRFFAWELARITGATYYGRKGLDSKGRYIEDAKPSDCVIASIPANSTGRNLQTNWSRNLITSGPTGGASATEQLLGRTHRDGQRADEVTCDILFACWEHFDGWTRTRAEALMTQDTMGQPQKVLMADCNFPSEHDVRMMQGHRWQKTPAKVKEFDLADLG